MSATFSAAHLVRHVAVGSGVVPLLGRLTGGIGAILMLHRVRNATWSSDPGASVTPETFLEIVRYLRMMDYDIVSLDDALVRGGAGERRFACLTFDDGYRDNYEVLWPLARREQVPITIYLTTGYIDGSHPAWWLLLDAAIATRASVIVDGMAVPTATPEEKSACYDMIAKKMPADANDARRDILQWLAAQDMDADTLLREHFMTWPMVDAMKTDPLVTFGGHTVSHPRLAALTDADAAREIESCRDRLTAGLGQAPRHFAIPFGLRADSGPRDIALARRAGFASVVHAYGGPVRRGRDPMNLPRIPIGGRDNTADLAVRLSGVRTFLQAI